MGSILTLLVVVAIIAGVVWLVRQQQATKARELDDAKTEARRWVELTRLGGLLLAHQPEPTRDDGHDDQQRQDRTHVLTHSSVPEPAAY